jgi:signal transduction histidine kinase
MKDAAEATSWTVVLRPDGVVDDVQGGAPFSWVGHALSALPEVPEALSRAAAGLRTAADGHWVRHGRVVCAVGRENVAVDLVVCHAVPLRRTHVIVRDMVLRVLDLFHLQAPDSGVDVHLEYADVVPVSFPADGEKITWAAATLIGNALRHFQREHEPNTKPRISIVVDYEFETSELLIRVVDNGPGIPSDRKRWLFEQNPQTGQATGLALVMVKDVVLAHNGSVEVESRAGIGTAITLRLPRA